MTTSLDSLTDSSLLRWFRSSNPQVVQTIAQIPDLGEWLSFVEEPKHIRRLEVQDDTLIIDVTQPLLAAECWKRYLSLRSQAPYQIVILTWCAGDPYLYETSHRRRRKLEDWN
ncbi:MAG: hypothetical protein HC769_30430 [Cyanobacteria bacterium CRU_2_1]|nr:hypothetical protein [Cyanobacteria bacterium CRU_2_1]